MEVDGTVGVESPNGQSSEPEQLTVVERSSELIRRLIDRLNEGGRPDQRAAWEAIQNPDAINTLV